MDWKRFLETRVFQADVFTHFRAYQDRTLAVNSLCAELAHIAVVGILKSDGHTTEIR